MRWSDEEGKVHESALTHFDREPERVCGFLCLPQCHVCIRAHHGTMFEVPFVEMGLETYRVPGSDLRFVRAHVARVHT